MSGMFCYVPIASIVVQPQVRDVAEDAELAALAGSIARHGVLVPLLGHDEDGEIILDDGHRRLVAARQAGLASVPMVVSDGVPSPAGRTTMQLVANAFRADLRVMEKARAIQLLMQDAGWTASEVSARLGGPSPSSISKLLALLVLPRHMQDLIDAGKIPMSSAYAIATVTDAAERERLVGEVVGGKLTRDGLVERIAARKQGNLGPRARKPAPARKERVTIPLGQGRSIALSAPSLTPECLVASVSELLDRLRDAAASGRPLPEVLELVTGRKPGRSRSSAPAGKEARAC